MKKDQIVLTFNSHPSVSAIHSDYEIQRLTRAATDLGFNIVKLGGQQLITPLDEDLPRAVFNMSQMTTFSHQQYLRDLELRGVGVLNPIYNSIIADDKMLSYIELKNSGFPVPKTLHINPLFLDDKGALIKRINDDMGWPCVLKITNSSLGRGVIKINTQQEFEDTFSLLNICSLRTANNDTTAKLLIQEYIKESQGQTVRVIVLNNKCLGSYLKLSHCHWKANTTSGSYDRKPFELTNTLSEMSLNICKLFRLNYAGIDFLMGKHGFLVGEINTVPMLKGFDLMHSDLNIYPEIIKGLIN
jgi:ribosomal protein S6--L-glutamate ligase